MNIGYIGLGKMGANMVARLIEKGHTLVTYTQPSGGTVESLTELVGALPQPRLVWIMVPHTAVESVLTELVPLLHAGDTIIDGGNSPYQESVRRSKELTEQNILFLDVGVSGGPSGARNGACLMVGGDRNKYSELEWLWKDLSVEDGYGYMGASGAGHFVKMVHNGIEYGMMQSLAEGFDLLRHSDEFALDMERVSAVYGKRSVITGRLVSWLNEAFKTYGDDLTGISGSAASTGEGAWTKEAADRNNISVPDLDAALAVRAASQKDPSYQGQIISALREQFGKHNAHIDTK